MPSVFLSRSVHNPRNPLDPPGTPPPPTPLTGGLSGAPSYNMKTGFRDAPKGTFSIPSGGLLVIEGIHALNPSYTSAVAPEQVFKIFLSPQTALQVGANPPSFSQPCRQP